MSTDTAPVLFLFG